MVRLHIWAIRLFTLLTIKDQHHTVQVARVQVENLNLHVSVTEWVTPPAYVAACDNHHMCKWRVFAPVDRRKVPQVQGAKVRTHGAMIRTSISVLYTCTCGTCTYHTTIEGTAYSIFIPIIYSQWQSTSVPTLANLAWYQILSILSECNLLSVNGH